MNKIYIKCFTLLDLLKYSVSKFAMSMYTKTMYK